MQHLLEYASEALDALWRNRTRSFLTMIGMIVGTSSVIAVFGISRASATGITSTITSFGRPAVFLEVDATQNFPQSAAIDYRDVAKIATLTQGLLDAIEPNYQRFYRVRAGNVSDYEQIDSTGGYDGGATIALQEGRTIDDEDVATATRVCVLTADLARKYFPNGPALGATMTIDGSRFRVAGVYGPINGSLFNTLAGNGTIFIPYSAFHRLVPGPVDFLLLYTSDAANPAPAIDAVKIALQHIHGPQAQYITQNGADAFGAFVKVLNIITAGLSAIGAVSLLVAGIGVMNIMLVSVAERTREIGIRKSVGANQRSIALQFLMEALMLCVLGGGIGTLLGLGLTASVSAWIDAQLGTGTVPYVFLIGIAAAFSIGIGVIFGTYPALRAARLDPIEALRSS